MGSIMINEQQPEQVGKYKKESLQFLLLTSIYITKQFKGNQHHNQASLMRGQQIYENHQLYKIKPREGNRQYA